MQQIFASFLPELIDDAALIDGTCIVVDVLRATTTITYALAAGATRVIACREIDEARRIAGRFPKGAALLAGERRGLLIPGFDLANSPDEFTPERVGGRTIVFTTTNGTQALARCRRAERVLLGAFANFSALCDTAAEAEELHLVCAGTKGEITREDVLLVGAIVDRLTQTAPCEVDDEAQIACDCWRAAAGAAAQRPAELAGSAAGAPGAAAATAARNSGGSANHDWLVAALRSSRGGRNLMKLGLEQDIRTAAIVDRYALVPAFDRATNSIEPLGEREASRP